MEYEDMNETLRNIRMLSKIVNRFSYDIILAVSRGGLIPARLIAKELNIKNIASCQVFRNSDGTRSIKYFPEDILPTDNILIVEDFIESGDGLNFLLKYLHEKDIYNYKTCSLGCLTKTKNAYKTDFYLDEFETPQKYFWDR